MTFAGINYLAILIAAVAGWLAGARLVRRCSARPWVAAQGTTMEEFKAQQAAMTASSRRLAPVHRSPSSPIW